MNLFIIPGEESHLLRISNYLTNDVCGIRDEDPLRELTVLRRRADFFQIRAHVVAVGVYEGDETFRVSQDLSSP